MARRAIKLLCAVLVMSGLIGMVSMSTGRDLRSDAMLAIAWAKDFTDTFSERLISAGVWGPIMLFSVYLVTTVLMLPLWGFHVAAGYAYGTFYSALFISTTQAICAGAAFLCSRYVAKPYITELLERWYGDKYRAIDAAVSKRGLYITVLLRLSPLIPFGVNNYLCGCTRIKVWQWVVGTFLGVLPGTSTYCYLGSIAKELASDDVDPTGIALKKTMMCVQFCAGAAVCWYLNRLAVAALREAGIGGDAARDASAAVAADDGGRGESSPSSDGSSGERSISNAKASDPPRRRSKRLARQR